MKSKKEKRKVFNFARALVFVLFIYIIVCIGLYIYKEPVRHYEISGNKYVSDMEILTSNKLDKYPAFITVSARKIKKNLEKNPYIKSAKITYGWNFVINIEIEENKPVFKIKSTDEIVLSDGSKVSSDNIIGVPTLLNQTPEKNLISLATNLKDVNEGILNLVSEIEYRQSYNSDNQVIDENRFLLSMSDGNLVFINSEKAKNLNLYLDIIATNQMTSKGTIYLDNDGEHHLVDLFDKDSLPESDEVDEEDDANEN